jgi:hypothetical protein
MQARNRRTLQTAAVVTPDAGRVHGSPVNFSVHTAARRRCVEYSRLASFSAGAAQGLCRPELWTAAWRPRSPTPPRRRRAHAVPKMLPESREQQRCQSLALVVFSWLWAVDRRQHGRRGRGRWQEGSRGLHGESGKEDRRMPLGSGPKNCLEKRKKARAASGRRQMRDSF